MNALLSRLLFAFLLAAFAASCSSSTPFEASAERAANAPVLAPAEPNSVQILNKTAYPNYVILGDVRLRLKGVRTVPDADVLSDPAILQAIRAQAASLGANAVVELMVIHRPGYGGKLAGGSSSAIPVEVRATAVRANLL